MNNTTFNSEDKQELHVSFEPGSLCLFQVAVIKSVEFMYSLGVMHHVGWSVPIPHCYFCQIVIENAPSVPDAEDRLTVLSLRNEPRMLLLEGRCAGIAFVVELLRRMMEIGGPGKNEREAAFVGEPLLPVLDALMDEGFADHDLREFANEMTAVLAILGVAVLEGRAAFVPGAISCPA